MAADGSGVVEVAAHGSGTSGYIATQVEQTGLAVLHQLDGANGGSGHYGRTERQGFEGNYAVGFVFGDQHKNIDDLVAHSRIGSEATKIHLALQIQPSHLPVWLPQVGIALVAGGFPHDDEASIEAKLVAQVVQHFNLFPSP